MKCCSPSLALEVLRSISHLRLDRCEDCKMPAASWLKFGTVRKGWAGEETWAGEPSSLARSCSVCPLRPSLFHFEFTHLFKFTLIIHIIKLITI